MDNVLDLYKSLREKYGKVYITTFPDDTVIPWHPLTIDQYLKYLHELQQGIIPPVLIENEIFHLCVVDDIFLREFNYLKAGIVSVVSQNIMNYSGPSTIDSFNQDLDSARNLLQKNNASLNDLVVLITMAFPYIPEQIYAMDYETLLNRAILAEAKLLQMNIIKQPIVIYSKKEEKKVKQRQPQQPSRITTNLPDQLGQQPPTPPLDAKKLWEQQQSSIPKENQLIVKKDSEPTDFSTLSKKKWWKNSPAVEAVSKEGIDFNRERAIINGSMPGSDRLEIEAAEQAMINDAQVIYKDLFAALDKKKKK